MEIINVNVNDFLLKARGDYTTALGKGKSGKP